MRAVGERCLPACRIIAGGAIPSPPCLALACAVQVAAAGLAALRAANVELIPVPGGGAGAASAGPSRAASAAPSRAASAVPSVAGSASGLPVGSAAAGPASSAVASSSGGVSTLLPKSWQPKSWRTTTGGGSSANIGGSSGSRQAGGVQSFSSAASSSLGSGVGSATGSPNPSPSGATYTRMPFVLRRVRGVVVWSLFSLGVAFHV